MAIRVSTLQILAGTIPTGNKTKCPVTHTWSPQLTWNIALRGPTYILHTYPIQDIGTSCFRRYQYFLTSFMKSKHKRILSSCLPVLMYRGNLTFQRSQATLPEKLLQKAYPRQLTREMDNAITAPRDVCPGQENKLCEIKISTPRLLVPSTIEKDCKVIKGPFNI